MPKKDRLDYYGRVVEDRGKEKVEKVVRDSQWYAMIGRKGGLNNKRKQLRKNPNYYSEIGLKGGMMMKKTRSKEFYSEIGKMGSKKQRSLKNDNQA